MFQSVLVQDKWWTSACTYAVGGFVVLLHVVPMGILEAFALAS